MAKSNVGIKATAFFTFRRRTQGSADTRSTSIRTNGFKTLSFTFYRVAQWRSVLKTDRAFAVGAITRFYIVFHLTSIWASRGRAENRIALTERAAIWCPNFFASIHALYRITYNGM